MRHFRPDLHRHRRPRKELLIHSEHTKLNSKISHSEKTLTLTVSSRMINSGLLFSSHPSHPQFFCSLDYYFLWISIFLGVENLMIFWGKEITWNLKISKRIFLNRQISIHGSSRQPNIYIRIFKCFPFKKINSQIQQNWLMDHHHINYITKLEKKKNTPM
jgi:hypothetical protein